MDHAETRTDREIGDLLERQRTAWNAGDLATLLADYWKDPAVRYASGTNVLHGFESIRNRFESSYPDTAAMGRLAYSGIEIAPIGDTDAVVFGLWRLDREESTAAGSFTLHMRKISGDWTIISDHTSA